MTLPNQARYSTALSGDTQEAWHDFNYSLRNKLNINDKKVHQQKSSEFFYINQKKITNVWPTLTLIQYVSITQHHDAVKSSFKSFQKWNSDQVVNRDQGVWFQIQR